MRSKLLRAGDSPRGSDRLDELPVAEEMRSMRSRSRGGRQLLYAPRALLDESDETLQKRRRARWAPGNVQIDGNDLLDSADAGIAAGK